MTTPKRICTECKKEIYQCACPERQPDGSWKETPMPTPQNDWQKELENEFGYLQEALDQYYDHFFGDTSFSKGQKTLEKLQLFISTLLQRERAVDADLLEEAWGIICNVSVGDWTKQSEDWRYAARRFREKYLERPAKLTKPSINHQSSPTHQVEKEEEA